MSSVGTESSTGNGYTEMGMFVPGGGTWRYNSTLSAVICSRVTRAGGRARSTAALYHPLIPCQTYRWREGFDPNSVSTSDPASSARLLLSSIKLAFILRPNLRINARSFAIYRRTETLSLTSLHVVSNIHAFFLTYRARGFGTAFCRAANILSSLIGSVGSPRGRRLRPLNYPACSLREALCRQPRNM